MPKPRVVWTSDTCYTLAFSDEFLQECALRVGDSYRVPVSDVTIDDETGSVLLTVRTVQVSRWKAGREERERRWNALTPEERSTHTENIVQRLGYPVRPESGDDE